MGQCEDERADPDGEAGPDVLGQRRQEEAAEHHLQQALVGRLGTGGGPQKQRSSERRVAYAGAARDILAARLLPHWCKDGHDGEVHQIGHRIPGPCAGRPIPSVSTTQGSSPAPPGRRLPIGAGHSRAQQESMELRSRGSCLESPRSHSLHQRPRESPARRCTRQGRLPGRAGHRRRPGEGDTWTACRPHAAARGRPLATRLPAPVALPADREPAQGQGLVLPEAEGQGPQGDDHLGEGRAR